MRFNDYLKSSFNQEWSEYYIEYETLKEILDSMEDNATQELEQQFVEMVRTQYKKINGFFNDKIQAMNRDMASQDKKYLMYQVSDLYRFANLNRIGMYKILKKHDKISSVPMLPYYSIKLHPNSFCPHKEIFNIFSKLAIELKNMRLSKGDKNRYQYLKTEPPTQVYLNLKEGKMDVSGMQDDTFERKSEKYWIPPKDLHKVMTFISKHLPIYFFDEEHLAQETTSIYMDTDDLACYHRRIRKDEGAELLRLRWYGEFEDMDTVFAELKTHHESWTVKKSQKARFPIPKDFVHDFLTSDKYVADEGTDEKLVTHVKKFIHNTSLRPSLATKYTRFAFQDTDNDYLRISVDTNLRMIKKDQEYSEWFSCHDSTDADKMHLFPYAVMEVKLREPFIENRPIWLQELIQKKEIISAENFSKYGHGCATLIPDKIKLKPYWLEQYAGLFEGDDLENINAIKRISYANSSTTTNPKVFDSRTAIDPRTVLALERNFYHWSSMCIGLYKMSHMKEIRDIPYLRIGILCLAVVAAMYGATLYYRRFKCLDSGNVHDYPRGAGLYGFATTFASLAVWELYYLYF